MDYSIKTNMVDNATGNFKAYATLTIGDEFVVNGIAVLKKKNSDELYIRMPSYKTDKVDENGFPVYKDYCGPLTTDFYEELRNNIINCLNSEQHTITIADGKEVSNPEYSVNVGLYEDGKGMVGLGNINFEDKFWVNSVRLYKKDDDGLNMLMPSKKESYTDENNQPVYRNICFPCTKEFREELQQQFEATYAAKVDLEQQNVKKIK